MTQRIDINPRAASVLSMLSECGYQAHLVGGAVRNALLGHAVKDYDISTNAHPQQVSDVFEGKGLSVLPTGIDHGTVTVLFKGEPFEITTWRRDVATDGRRAVVAFADSLTEDALRRDFTINALYASSDGLISDPTGQGLEDISLRKVRFIGDASERIREDALRILRYFRFVGRFAAEVDLASEDYLSCVKHADLIDSLSRERVGQELLQILSLKDCSIVLDAMDRAGAMSRVLPQDYHLQFQELQKLHQVESAMGLPPCPLRRLALLTSSVPKDELRLSKAQVRHFLSIVSATKEDPMVLGYRYGADLGASVHALFLAITDGVARPSDNALLNMGAAQKLPVSSKDLGHRFQGPALGEALKKAEDLWLSKYFQMSRTEILEKI